MTLLNSRIRVSKFSVQVYTFRVLNLVLFLLFLSPIFHFYFGRGLVPIYLWMFGSIMGFVLLLPFLIKELIENPSAYLFILFVIVGGIWGLIQTNLNVILPLILFMTNFGIFLGLINTYNKLTSLKYLVKYLHILILIVCLYAIYQSIAHFTGLPFSGVEIYRGRAYGGFIPQVSSFFDEPAFLSLFLISMLYVLLFVFEEKKWSVISLILFSTLMSRSLGGIFASAVLIVMYFVSQINISLIIKLKVSKATLISSLLALLITSIAFYFSLKTGVISSSSQRIKSEVLYNLDLIGNDPRIFEVSGSGGIRIVNEINFFLVTLNEKPFSGFGIAYDAIELNRRMALNALVEVVIRWGIIGLILFSLVFIYELLIHKPKHPFVFLLFLLLYFTIDGGIAKAQYWIFLGLVILCQRMVNFSKKSTIIQQ